MLKIKALFAKITAKLVTHDANISALQTAAEQTGDTLRYNSSITASRGGARIRRIGNTVFFSGGIGNATSTVNTGTNLFERMPVEYRPPTNVTLQGMVNQIMGNFTISSDGYVRQTLTGTMAHCFVSGFWTV